MDTRTYHITITGESPLLMHSDDLQWRGTLERWQAEPENKKLSRAGDDRTPPWRWLGSCYHDGQWLGMAADNLMTTLREGGARVPVPGKRNLTYKRQSQSGLIVNELLWPLVTPKGRVAWTALTGLLEEKDFAKHEEAALALGFSLFAKSVRIGQSKHIRVRPRFDSWACEGTITVFDETITESVLQTILVMSGTYCGLGDWRPSAPSKPGPFGKFNATVEAIK